MHELSVTQNILEIALRHAAGQRISEIELVIGQLSSFVDDSIQFYWDIISAGTPAEGARLRFKRIPAQMRCLKCGENYTLEGDFTCPQCGAREGRLVAGNEFYVDSISVEEEARVET